MLDLDWNFGGRRREVLKEFARCALRVENSTRRFFFYSDEKREEARLFYIENEL